ncbi:hypothetical protein [Asticcacaulis solisilvae]|uniref:hypothetical protein n=1 Tax=Asticcacaulis solisilvae TaxID=1217274 RepID=UPI003FD7CE5B
MLGPRPRHRLFGIRTEKLFEWFVILAVVAGIVFTGVSALRLVTTRLTSVDDSVQLLRARGPCQYPQTDHGPADRAEALVCLEQETVYRRYVGLELAIQSRLWTRYYACVAGFMLISVGAVFIIMKVREKPFNVSAGGQVASVSLQSASPGLGLSLLGTLLLVVSVSIPGEAATSDEPAYLSEKFQAPDADGAARSSMAASVAALTGDLPPLKPHAKKEHH